MAKNPLTDFKNRYAGKDTTADKISGKVQRQMELEYLRAFNAIYRKINEAKKDVSYGTFAKQTQLMKQIGAELDSLKKRSGSYLRRAIKEITKYGTRVAINDLEVLGSGATQAGTWHREYNLKYAEQVFKDNFAHIAAQTDKMKRDSKTQLRMDSAKIFRRAAVTGMTRKQAYAALKSEIALNDPSFTFVDRRGRRWKTETYFDMLTKTVMANTLRETYAQTLINEGHDLVRVTFAGAKDACRHWEGRVLSLTGATPGYLTLEDARASGELFHPRCRHSTVAYHSDIEEVFDAVKADKKDA